MLYLLIACTVGSSGPSTPDSVSAVEAAELGEVAKQAGKIANKARELEAATTRARQAVGTGADKQAEAIKLESIMAELETLNAALQAEHSERIERIETAAQSTAATRE